MTMAVDFDAIRHSYPLDAVVGQSRKLVKSGRNKLAVCPFHPDRSPSLVLYPDDTYHCFGCGQHGDVIDYVAGTQHLNIGEAIRFLTGGNAPRLDDADQQRREREARHREAEHKRKQENATLGARDRWARALPINGCGNAYLERKNVAPYGCRREGDNLLVPMFGPDGLIQSVQAIEPNGKKLFHASAPAKGAVLPLGNDTDGPIVVAEGFATGATVQAASGFLVYVGFSKGALLDTARIVAERHAGRPIIVAADVNGLEAAERAASAVSGRVVVPDLQGADGSDFNDQAAHYGLEDVAAIFAAAEMAEVGGSASLEASAKVLGFCITDWSTDKFFGEAPPIRWLCEGTIPLGVPALFAAMGGIGKSFMALDMALEIAAAVIGDDSDRRILGGPVIERGSVVVLGAEDAKDSVHRRMARIDTGGRREQAVGRLFVVPLPDVGGPIPLISGGGGEFTRTDKFHALLSQLEAIADLKLIVIDPLQAFVTADITKDPAAGQFMWSAFAQLCARTGATVIACHHMRKEGSFAINSADQAREAIRGSTALIDGARATYALWGASEDDTKRVCTEAGVEFKPKRVVHGAVVKSNDEHDWDIHTYLRGENGLLRDAHDAGRRAAERSTRMTEAQCFATLQAIDKRWRAGRPYSAAANSADRYVVSWMTREWRVSKEVAKSQLETWFHQEMVVSEVFSAKTKMVGLRVQKWPD